MPTRLRIIAIVACSALLTVGSAAGQPAYSVDSEGLGDGDMLIRSDASMALLRSGRLAIINFRLHEAERTFTSLANLPDGRPSGLFHLSTVSFFRFLMSDSESDRLEFERRSSELKRELDDLPDSPWRAYLGAETNLQRSVVRAKTGKYVRAALAARTSYKEFERLVEEYPAFYDGYKGYGLLQLAIGSMPSTYRKFLSLIGYSGRVDVGLSFLDRTAEQGSFSRDEAAAISSLARILLLNPTDGLEGLAQLHQQYPESTLFAHLYGYALFENRNAAAAAEQFQFVVNRSEDVEQFPIDYARYFLGMSYFRMNRFAEAELYLESYIEHHGGLALHAPATLNLGIAIEMQGRRVEAVQVYRSVNASRELDLDEVSKRMAERLIQEPLAGVARSLMLGANDFDAGNYEQAELELIAIANGNVDDESRAEATYRLGRIYQVTDRGSLALDSYRTSVSLKGEELSRWAPWSEYYTGRILEQQGERLEARKAYERALSYGGKYDYYQALASNSKLGIQRLK